MCYYLSFIIMISSSINHYHFALSATTKAENKSIANYYLKEGMHAMIDLYNIAVLELLVVFLQASHSLWLETCVEDAVHD